MRFLFIWLILYFLPIAYLLHAPANAQAEKGAQAEKEAQANTQDIHQKQTHKRIVSLSMCADPYLMAFAEPSQILALSPQSRDPSLSAFTEEAAAWPASTGRMEDILKLAPDLLIISAYSSATMRALIESFGIQVIVLDAAQNYAAARQEILELGELIGRSTQAQAYLTQLDRQLAATQTDIEKDTAIDKARPPIRYLNYQRRGLTIGMGHIIDDIITLAGGVNLGRQIGKSIGPMNLETVIRMQPDFLITESEQQKPIDRGSEILTHPALTVFFPAEKQIFLPTQLLVCAGATTPQAVAHIKAEIKAKKRAK